MSEVRKPSIGLALVPVLLLMGLLALSYLLFEDGAALGPNQVALAIAAMGAYWVGRRCGHSTEDLRDAGVQGVSTGMSAIFILLAVGSLIGTWAMSGTLLSMVYYGMTLLQPNYLYMSTCIICAVVALSIGSSWTVAGTIGIGLIGVSQRMGLDPAITAGAVISGAYFGDKSSPLSDTANLACAAAGSQLYDHVRESLWTSVPSLVIALAVFWMLGSPGDFDASATIDALGMVHSPSLLHFLPLVLVLALALRRWPPTTTIMLGALAGGVLAVIDAPERVLAFAAAPELPAALGLLKGVWQAMATGFVSETSVGPLDELLTRGGMSSMMGTIWLIITALGFGGIAEKAGVLDVLIAPLIRMARSTGALIATLVGSAIATNALASDQYIALVLPGRMFRGAFEQRGLAPVVQSRALGDSATVTSPLIPWNSCGAYMAAALGVGTLSYLPYAIFNLANPVISILFGVLGLRMLRARTGTQTAD